MGSSVLPAGGPFSRERQLLSFGKHFRLSVWQRDKRRNKERKLLTDRRLHPRGGAAASFYALTDRSAGETGMKAGRMLTYAFNAQRYVRAAAALPRAAFLAHSNPRLSFGLLRPISFVPPPWTLRPPWRRQRDVWGQGYSQERRVSHRGSCRRSCPSKGPHAAPASPLWLFPLIETRPSLSFGSKITRSRRATTPA